MGDFYETFDGDAEIASSLLGIALTSRPMGGEEGRVPLAGVPVRSLERHLDRLVAAGHRVAIAEQTSEPGHGLVERRVVRVVTPGTVGEGALLEGGGHNWLVALAPAEGGRSGLAACDVTTGELECSMLDAEQLPGEWARLQPAEVLLAEDTAADVLATEGAALPEGALVTRRPPREFAPGRAAEALCERLGVASLDGYGLEGLEAAVGAAGALLAYLEESWPQALPHLRAPHAVRAGDYLYLDAQTQRSLELFDGGPGAGRGGGPSLLATVDRTLTAMGGRLLRARLGRPLRRPQAIEARLDEVEGFVDAPVARGALRQGLRGLPDVERLLGRVRAGTATAPQLRTLGLGLGRLPALGAQAGEAGEAAAALGAGLGGVAETAALLAAAIADQPPEDVDEGGTLRAGFDAEVDELRELAADAREALAALETAERERSGIAALKVGYHRVFGYYLEVPRGRADEAPEDYEPRQTLANAQRFRSPALSALEDRILSARDRLGEAERAALLRVRAQVAEAGPAIERAAAGVAQLDVAAALAELAADHGYVRPELAEGGAIEIEGGRHPVVERQLDGGRFVPNDCVLGAGADVMILTGPNMGGKSTYLRQVALIVLLAHCGSYVPASRARIAAVDRIFSRVGAHDDIAAGRSTFMVEMLETAAILHNATERSLIVLDEVGRGTSTYDGLAIARAVIEHLHHRPGGTPRTLFATHYHELVALARTLPRVENRTVAVSEQGGEVVFEHRVVAGGADRSYGVHVAALAGLPRAVVARARELLHELEAAAVPPSTAAEGAQLPLLGEPQAPPSAPTMAAAAADGLIDELAAIDPDELAPLEALQRLYELRRRARERLALED